MLYTIHNGLSRKNPFPEKSISGRLPDGDDGGQIIIGDPVTTFGVFREIQE
jgi:hypothetical protein